MRGIGRSEGSPDPGALRASGALRAAAVAILLSAAVACGDSVAPPGLLTGSWGGDGFGLSLEPDRGTARFDCAVGALEAPVRPGPDGRFSVAGDYAREIGPTAFPNPAHYEGRVLDDRLELAVVVTDTLGDDGVFLLGPFRARRGADPDVAFCQ